MCSIMAVEDMTDISDASFREHFAKTHSRGPDDERIMDFGKKRLGFQRLSIMGLTPEGMQPFVLNENAVVCNGELYGFRKEKEILEKEGYIFKSDSDCEILLPMYEKYGTEMFKRLDAEFACVIYDAKADTLIAARDPFGIRPLFYGYDDSQKIVFASEAKDLVGLVKTIIAFPPGYYYKDGKFTLYRDISARHEYIKGSIDDICAGIRERLITAVDKRLDADAPVGFLLSGGLDSSLVCAISQKLLGKPIETYAIGMKKDAIDLKYAKEAADYIGSDHHEVIIDRDTVISSLEEVIAELGTYDITTIRASMGMYLCCKAIHERSNIRVLLTGEISDELFGYKYTDYAPNAEEFQKEAEKRVHELYFYDVLRADRCISTWSMEARVPFGDLDFASYVMSIDPELKMNKYNKGKYLLRHAFEGTDYLPHDLLFREKAAFSDAVGHSMVDDIKEYAETVYTDEEFKKKAVAYGKQGGAPVPFTKESLLYRDLFEKYYPGQAQMIPAYWMPNKNWENCDVDDPSARVLKNYGASGF